MCQSFFEQDNKIASPKGGNMPTLFKHRKTRAAGSTTCLQLVAPARHSHLNPQVSIQKHPGCSGSWLPCTPVDGFHHGKSPASFYRTQLAAGGSKEGLVRHPNSDPTKVGRYVATSKTEQVVRKGRPRFPIFKSSAVLLSKTQQALPLLARCALS